MHPSQMTDVGQKLVALTPLDLHTLTKLEESELLTVADALHAEIPEFRDELETYVSLRVSTFPSTEPQRLLVDDFSPITHLQHILGLQYYTSRAFVRAGEGDIVLGTFEPLTGYIEYMSERLGLGTSTYLSTTPPKDTLPYAVFASFLTNVDALHRLVDALASSQEALWLHPYMGHQGAWQLGQRLREVTQREVRVAAPPPRLCFEVNNKVWFTHAVAQTLGESYVIPGHAAYNAVEAAGLLRKVAEAYPTVSIKLADSASGMGTGIFERDEVLGPPEPAWTQRIQAWMTEKDWIPDESPPLLIEPWYKQLQGSPSVQLWLPPVEIGPPLVEGIYDQLFHDNDPHVFLGSIPSQLPQERQQELIDTGAQLGRVFQHLGYVGRCSFDTILEGPSLDEATLRYVECNGRWGGTSTPMTLMNRIFGDYRSQPYVAKDFDHESLRGLSVADFVKRFDDILYNTSTGKGWAIVYNVGCLKPSGKLDIITLGSTFQEAQERQKEFAARVHGR